MAFLSLLICASQRGSTANTEPDCDRDLNKSQQPSWGLLQVRDKWCWWQETPVGSSQSLALLTLRGAPLPGEPFLFDFQETAGAELALFLCEKVTYIFIQGIFRMPLNFLFIRLLPAKTFWTLKGSWAWVLSLWACECPFGVGTHGRVLFTAVCKGSGSGIRPEFESDYVILS